MFVSDTHSLVWYLTKSPKLGREALKVFHESARGECTIIIPTVVLAEVLYISEKKRISIDFAEVLNRIESSSNFEVADLNIEIVRTAGGVKQIADLHDRIIIATAIVYSAPILTKDERVKESNQVSIIW